MTPEVQQHVFGVSADGRDVTAFTLTNGTIQLTAITLGCIITRLRTPDRQGQAGDVIIGFDTVGEYERDVSYQGAFVGRVAGRIAHAQFSLDGRSCELPRNAGTHHLHGGPHGFTRQHWAGAPFTGAGLVGVEFTRRSPAGEEGYPGELDVTVRYSLDAHSQVRIEYEAVTDAPTPVNFTQHAYFNLSGGQSENVVEHQLRIAASRFLAADDDLLPTGELAPVAGTPFDLRSPRRLGDVLALADPQLRLAGGIDHSFVLDREQDAVTLADPVSGRTLEVATSAPIAQVYTGNFLDGSVVGRRRRLVKHAGICLETEEYANAVNQSRFPSIVLRPGQRYGRWTTWTFGCLELA